MKKSSEQIRKDINSNTLSEYDRICVIYSDSGGALTKNEWNNLLPHLKKKYSFDCKFPTLSQQRFIFIYKNKATWGESCYRDISTIGMKFSEFSEIIENVE